VRLEPKTRRWYLVPSPLLGPSCWRGVAEVLVNTGQRVLVAESGLTTTSDVDHVSPWVNQLSSIPRPDDDLPVIVVGHSAACPRIPLLASELLDKGWNVESIICVDGRLPDGAPFTATPEFGHMLDAMVRPDDYLPPWPLWWGSLVIGLVIDPALREQVLKQAKPIPRTWFDQGCPVPDLPPRVGRGYLAFGDGYIEAARQAVSEGWEVMRLEGDHLHQIVQPEAVTEALSDIVVRLALESGTR